VELVRAFARLTPAQIVRERYPAMSWLKRRHGLEKVEGVLAVLLVEASQAFATQFDEETALAMSAEIQSTFYYYSLEDCYYVLQQMKKSKQYGTQLTENKVLSAFADYEKERTQAAAEMSYNEHLSNKENPNAHDRNDSVLKSRIYPTQRNPNERKK
jgi:hypothetical protein